MCIRDRTELYLFGNQLAGVPAEIGRLTNLTWLRLGYNQLTGLPAEIGRLTNLTSLDLRVNQLAGVPAEIGRLTNLTKLFLGGNQLTGLPAEIGELTNLTRLDLYNNQLAGLPGQIGELTNLTVLNLGRNQLTGLPAEIGRLRNLKRLDILNNKLTSLPREVLDTGLEVRWEWKAPYYGVFCEGNPWEVPPVEVVKQGTEAVRRYFEGLEEPEARALNEVKVLLVGTGGSGKTSLVKRLRENKHNPDEPQTHGINIDDWAIKVGGKDILVHFWDFGGQDIMHSTHQFFLSKRSLYVLVLDGRKDEDAEYWLKHIESFGGDSPIMVVINKIDENPAFDVNRPFLQGKYKGIQGFYRMSCRKGEKVEEFADALKGELGRVEMIGTTWPKSWFEVKTRLEGMKEEKKDFISCEEYRNLCGGADLEDEETQDVLVQYLNDLGVVVHFPDLALEDTHVLEPRWLTGAVYKIVNSPLLVESKGVLKLDMLRKILRKKPGEEFTYPPSKHAYILELMKRFELCFAMDGGSVLLPDLQEVKEPEFVFERENSLRFYFEYDFLPRSVMPRFIVQSHRDIDGVLRWRTGVVLRDRDLGARALIIADIRDKKIYVYVSGEQRLKYFAHIRKTFRDIHGSFEKLDVKEWVPLPDAPVFAVEYEELIGHEVAKREEIFVGKLRRAYSVSDLLNGIESPMERIERGRIEGKDMTGEIFDTFGKGSIYVDARSMHTSIQKQDVLQVQKTDINIALTGIQEEFDELKDMLAGELGEKEAGKLKEVGDALDSVTARSSEEKKNGALNKAARFLKQLGDEGSETNKIVKGLKKGSEYITKVVRLYNKIAPFVGYPSIPIGGGSVKSD